MLAFWDVLSVVDGCAVVCNPYGPGSPFATPWLAVCDTLRVLCVLGAVGIVGLLLKAIRGTDTAGQRSRLVALGLFGLVAVDTEAVHFGDYPSIRLALTLAAIALSLHGMRSIFRHEYPAQPRDPGAGNAE